MQETFFTSKQAADITRCTLRQLQYWREKGVVVPAISGTGTGRSVYYSRSELVKLAAMEYCLSVGLSFEAAATTVKLLEENQPEFTKPASQGRFMLWWDKQEQSLQLIEFDLEKAISSLKSGQPVIPVWLDQIDQQIQQKLTA